MTSTCRVEVSHYVPAAVSADKWVNTIYFDGVDPANYDALALDVKAAFFALPAFPLYSLFNGDVRVYDLADPKPRPERAFEAFVSGSPLAVTNMAPDQVALCLSYYSTRNLPRQRGRIYIGPFALSGTAVNSCLIPPGGPTVNHFNALVALGEALKAITHGTWSVFSSKDGVHHITNGWVDNRWDTQRRRLPKATARTLWP